MLEPLRAVLDSKRIILASSSPRRKEIFDRNIKMKFETISSDYEEDLNPLDFPDVSSFVIETALNKALDIQKKVAMNYHLIISADSMVTCQGSIFGKPKDKADAKRMLTELSSNVHSVYSGVCLLWKDDDGTESIDKFSSVSHVKFSDISESIDAYLTTNEHADKAGAYGIQGLGGTFVESIEGDYYNIVGFPLHLFCLHVIKHFKNKSSVNCE